MERPSFAPLSAEAFAAEQARRAEAEAEIERREAELAAASSRLERAMEDEGELQAELDALKRKSEP